MRTDVPYGAAPKAGAQQQLCACARAAVQQSRSPHSSSHKYKLALSESVGFCVPFS